VRRPEQTRIPLSAEPGLAVSLRAADRASRQAHSGFVPKNLADQDDRETGVAVVVAAAEGILADRERDLVREEVTAGEAKPARELVPGTATI
jgi:hypothetical protein